MSLFIDNYNKNHLNSLESHWFQHVNYVIVYFTIKEVWATNANKYTWNIYIHSYSTLQGNKFEHTLLMASTVGEASAVADPISRITLRDPVRESEGSFICN